jgi:hypothetical protein
MYRDANGVQWAMVPESGGGWHAIPDQGGARYYDPTPSRTQSSSQQGAVAAFIEQYARTFAANVRERASVPGWLWLVIGYVLLKGER